MTMPTRQTLLGYGSALVAAASYGAGAIAAKKAVTDVASPMTTTAFALLFGTLIMLAALPRAYGEARSAPRRSVMFMALAGVAGVWGVGFYHLALMVAPVVLVTPVANTYPLMTMVVIQLFMQRMERVTLRTALGAALVVAGVGLISVGQGT